MNRRIADYIQRHRAVYTKDALRQMLLQQGYNPAEIEETFAAVEAGQLPPTGLTLRFWLIFIGYLLLLYGIPLVLFGLTPGGLFVVPILGVLLFIAAGISILVAALSRSAAMGLTSGLVLVFVLPIVFLVLLAGSCLALVAPILFAPQPEPPRNGTLELHIDPPMSFDGSGDAICYVDETGAVYSLTAFDVARLDGDTVSVYADIGTSFGEFSISLQEDSTGRPLQSYGRGASGEVHVNARERGLSGEITFEDLPGHYPFGASDSGEIEPISGTVAWDCD